MNEMTKSKLRHELAKVTVEAETCERKMESMKRDSHAYKLQAEKHGNFVCRIVSLKKQIRGEVVTRETLEMDIESLNWIANEVAKGRLESAYLIDAVARTTKLARFGSL